MALMMKLKMMTIDNNEDAMTKIAHSMMMTKDDEDDDNDNNKK